MNISELWTAQNIWPNQELEKFYSMFGDIVQDTDENYLNLAVNGIYNIFKEKYEMKKEEENWNAKKTREEKERAALLLIIGLTHKGDFDQDFLMLLSKKFTKELKINLNPEPDTEQAPLLQEYAVA